MTTAPNQKTNKKAGLILLKIPYHWETGSSIEANPVESREIAQIQVSEYQSKIKKDDSATHYFLLIEGSIVPTVEWVSANEFVYHA